MATVTPTEGQVNSILEAVALAGAAKDYANAQICEMQLISGENYNMVWSTAYADTFPPANE